jgi:hypothetical protein
MIKVQKQYRTCPALTAFRMSFSRLEQNNGSTRNMMSTDEIQDYSKRSINFQKFILQKLPMPNPCPVYGWKGNLSKF